MSRRADRFDTGRVVTRALRTFRQLALPSLVLAALFTAGPEALAAWALQANPDLPDYAEDVLQIPLWMVALLGQATLTHAALRRQSGQAAPMMRSLEEAGSLYLPILAVSILTSIGITVGLFLLVVPGLYLAVLWSVWMPSLISRREGMLAAMNESGDLTEGRKFRVLALCVVALLIVLAPWFILYFTWDQLPPETYVVINLGIYPAMVAISSLVLSFGPASLYHELRWGEGGPTDEAAAAVFD